MFEGAGSCKPCWNKLRGFSESTGGASTELFATWSQPERSSQLHCESNVSHWFDSEIVSPR